MYKWECVNNCNNHDWRIFLHMDYCKTLSEGLNSVIRSMFEYSQSKQDDGINYKNVMKDAELCQTNLKSTFKNLLF